MRSENRTNDQQNTRSFIETARRAQIVENAIEVLAEVGYGKASLALIAERTGVSKGVISYHFKGKADLFAQIETEIVRGIVDVVRPRMEAESTAAGKLHAYIRANLEYLRDHRSHLLALTEVFYMNVHAEGRRLAYDSLGYEPVLSVLERIFRQGQRDGEFVEFDPRVMAVTVQSAIDFGVALQWDAYPDMDLDGYIVELIALFDRATRKVEERHA